MRLMTIVLLALLLPYSAMAQKKTSAASVSITDRRFVEEAAAVLVAQIGDGIAESEPRIVFGKVSGGTGQDAIVYFGYEGLSGGNSVHEYLAVYAAIPSRPGLSRSRPYRLAAVKLIGHRGWRSFDSTRIVIRNGVITIPGNYWKQEDAMCCPSGNISTTFKLQNGELVEVKK